MAFKTGSQWLLRFIRGIFADKGVHVHSVVGANSLRGGVPLVLKAIVEVTQPQSNSDV
jgi:hypothetical protein